MKLYFHESRYGLTISEHNLAYCQDYEVIWECEIDIPSFVIDVNSKERVLARVKLLEAQIDEERVRAQVRIENLQEQIQELLALEYLPADDYLTKDDPPF